MTETTKAAGRTIGDLAEESNRLHDENVQLRGKIAEYAKMELRFQYSCSHTYGSMYDGKKSNLCPNCGWDKDKCQHKVSTERGDNFCTDCGERLRGGESA